MPAVRGSSLPITVYVEGVDLTQSGTVITMVFARKWFQSPALTKTNTGGAIVVTHDAQANRSTLTLTLTDAETANWAGEVLYTIYVGDGTPGGDWIPDVGGTGSIQFAESVKKS